MRRGLIAEGHGAFALSRIPRHFQNRFHLLFQHFDAFGLIGDDFREVFCRSRGVGEALFEVGDFICVGHGVGIKPLRVNDNGNRNALLLVALWHSR